MAELYLIGIIIIVFFFLYPILIFLHRRPARRIAPELGPSWWTMFLYVWVWLGTAAAIIMAPVLFPMGARYRSSEAKTNPGAIFTTQMAYFGENESPAPTL